MIVGGAEVMVMVMICRDKTLGSPTQHVPLDLCHPLENEIHYVNPYMSCLTLLLSKPHTPSRDLLGEMAQIYLESRVKW